MMDAAGFWASTDGVGRAVGLVLLAMSVFSWVLIGWKFWLLHRARRGLNDALAVFWAAPDWETARTQVVATDVEQVLVPLLDAAKQPPPPHSLAEQGTQEARLTRQLRDALQRVVARLQWGQVGLASIGATAPFVGLLGTVWGIQQALLGLSAGGALTIDRIAGPVGEALLMTAAGLLVAIPAVLAYNMLGKRVATCEAALEGFAHDLLAWVRTSA
jgi:biopolymer transport protein ExbB